MQIYGEWHKSRGRLAGFCLLLAVLILPFSAVSANAQTGPANAQSGSDIDELIKLLDQTTRMRGSFSQLQYDSDKVLLGESSGSFAMLRPGYFSWHIQSPDSQLIIATPEYIWHHDIDLETVTRRPVKKSAAMSPLQILGGDEALLRSQFVVTQSAAGSFILTPHIAAGDTNPGFKRLSLTLENGVLMAMEIIDALNQRVLITFQDVDKSPDLSPEDFAFTPPDGVDLFYYDE